MAVRADVDGAVLCGGASRRMSEDKAHIVIDGIPMYRRVLDVLAELVGTGTLVVVGGDPSRLDAAEAYVPDRWPGQGPLGGIITALTGPGSGSLVAVLSCDLIRPDPSTVSRLVAAHAAVECDVAVPVADGREQWTHAVWNRRVAPVLEARFDAGARAIRDALADVVVHRVDAAAAVADADRPEDLPRR